MKSQSQTTTLRTICLATIVMFGVANTAHALPPTGLTQIRTTADTTASLAVIEGVAYASTADGVYSVDSTGIDSLSVPVNPGLPPFASTTRVVQSADGDIVFVARFEGPGIDGSAMFELANLSQPVAIWEGHTGIVGIDENLRGLGRALFINGTSVNVLPAIYLPDGTVAELTVGPPASFFSPADLTPNGTAIGHAGIPGTLGAGPALLLPNGEVEFLSISGLDADIRQRADGNGVNASYLGSFYSVVYGGNPVIDIDRSIDGPTGTEDGGLQVSETNFAVVEVYTGPIGEYEEFRVYYPGVNPAGVDRSVSLYDLFPELTALDFNRVLDIASSEGQIHMLLSGDDGLWLFAAPDPSLIPEPSAIILTSVLCALAIGLRARLGR